MANIVEHLQKQEFPKVLAFCEQALARDPSDHNLLIVKGWCLFHLARTNEAIECIDQGILTSTLHVFSIKLAQDFFFLTNNHSQMIASSLLHLPSHPQDIDLWYRLALSRAITGEEDQAIHDFTHLLSLTDHAKAKVHLAGLLLNKGHYKKGFSLYEARFSAYDHCAWFNGDEVNMKLWQGEDLAGTSLLLWSEQGLGDTIQFIRLANVLAARGVKLSLLLKDNHKTLAELLQTVENIEQVYTVNNGQFTIPNTLRFHCPLLSLLDRLEVNNTHVPTQTPYLWSPSAHHSQWHFLSQNKKLKIGLVWSTQTPVDGQQAKEKLGTNDQHKNISLHQLAPLFARDRIHNSTHNSTHNNTQFFSLQYPVAQSDHPLLEQYGIVNLSDRIQSFTDTAAIVSHMDIVISIDTSVVHLAGALNKPTINLVPFINDWRWQKANGKSLWYPSMTLLKQKERGQWGGVVKKLVTTVDDIASQLTHPHVLP